MPQNMAATVAARRSGLAISTATAIRFGMAPPKPRPVAKRARSRASWDWAAAVTSEKRPNMATEPISTGLRPVLSASHPPAKAPITRPIIAALPAQPSCEGLRPSSGAICGAATPNAWMS